MRLGVVGGGDGERRDLARRIHRATVDLDAAPSDCDAVVLLNAEEGAVDRLLDAGKHVLFADETILTAQCLTAWAGRMPGGPRLAVVNRDRYLPSRQLICQQGEKRLGVPGLVRLYRW